jgi:hypothetical protein
VVNLNSFTITNPSPLLANESSSCFHDHTIGSTVLGPYQDLSIDLHKMDNWLGEILWDQDEEQPVRQVSVEAYI